MVNDEALASFDHILMAEIEKNKLDESVTQSNTVWNFKEQGFELHLIFQVFTPRMSRQNIPVLDLHIRQVCVHLCPLVHILQNDRQNHGHFNLHINQQFIQLVIHLFVQLKSLQVFLLCIRRQSQVHHPQRNLHFYPQRILAILLAWSQHFIQPPHPR